LANPAIALIYDEEINLIERGDFDNSKTRIPKARQDCEHLQRIISFVPVDEHLDCNVGEYLIYHDCRVCSKSLPCTHPARHCMYKVEEDEFINYFSQIVQENIKV
jgi:hypothetical protein